MDDSTLIFIYDLSKTVNNNKLKQILKTIYDCAPDLGYMDWNDREDYYENEYDGVLKDAAKELEKIIRRD